MKSECSAFKQNLFCVIIKRIFYEVKWLDEYLSIIIMSLLSEMKIKKWPIHAGKFVADKPNVGQAGIVAAGVVKGLVKARWHSIVVIPTEHFVLESSSVAVFLKEETI